MQIEIQIPKAVLFDVKYTVEQATNFAKKEVALGFYMQKGVSVALCSQIAGMSEKEFLVEVKDGFFQRTGALGGLRPVLHIVDGTLQAVDGEDTGICHLPFLFHQTPGLFGNPEHLLYAGFPCHPGAIGNMGKLVGIVAKSRNLSKKFCMMLTGLCLKLCA